MSVFVRLERLKEENLRLENNQEVLLDSARSYKDEYGRMVNKVGILELTTEEYKDEIKKLKLDVKKKDILLINQSSIETKDTVKVPIYNDRFEYKSQFLYLNGTISDSITINTVYRDSVIQVINRIPKRFLGIRVGTKGIEQTIILTNPNSQLKYNKTILFKSWRKERK